MRKPSLITYIEALSQYKSYDKIVVVSIYNNKSMPKSKFERQYTNANYFGMLNQDKTPHGIGIMKWKTCETYLGEYENGLRNGFGIHSFEDGSFEISSYLSNKTSDFPLYFL